MAPRVPTLPEDTRDLREQLMVDQAPSARSRAPWFDSLALMGYIGKPYSARHITINQIYEMRTDSVMAFSRLVSMVSLFQAKWHIECRDARKAEFLDRALRRIYGRFLLQCANSKDFGWQALVKQFGLMKPSWDYFNRETQRLEPVWDQGDIPALVWEPFVPLRPETVQPIWSSRGAFDGIRINDTGSFAFPTTPIMVDDKERGRKVDIKHALWVTNQRDACFGSTWGFSEMIYAFKWWWAGEIALSILDRSIERKGDPIVVVRFPVGSSKDGSGNERDNRELAEEIGSLARAGSVLCIPSEGHDEDEGGKSMPRWKIEYLTADEKFDKLTEILAYIDTQKIRSMNVADQAVQEGRGGTSSRNVAEVMGVRTAETGIVTQTELDAIINQYMIPQLAEAHYPILSDEPARKVTQTFGQDEADLAKTMLESFANANSDRLPIDWPKMLDRFQIDSLEGGDLEIFYRAQRKLAEQAESSQPPEQPASPNGSAGVTKVPAPTDTGFAHVYFDARETLEPPEDSSLLESLPRTEHFSDRTVLAHTRLVRRLWFDLLTDQYESFAEYVETGDVDLNDGDDAVEKVLDGWSGSGDTSETVGRTAQVFASIVERAGELALRRSRSSLDGWKSEDEARSEHARSAAASVARKVGADIRRQLGRCLRQGDAAKLRTRLAGNPAWMSDAVAREQAVHCYNVGVLLAANMVGHEVQALDQEDPEIHGLFFGFDDAVLVESKSRSRLDLAWRIIPGRAELAIERRPAEEMEWAARYDRDTGKVLLRDDLDAAAEGSYLVTVVDWLERVT